jgi:hypothetical protein
MSLRTLLTIIARPRNIRMHLAKSHEYVPRERERNKQRRSSLIDQQNRFVRSSKRLAALSGPHRRHKTLHFVLQNAQFAA